MVLHLSRFVAFVVCTGPELDLKVRGECCLLSCVLPRGWCYAIMVRSAFGGMRSRHAPSRFP